MGMLASILEILALLALNLAIGAIGLVPSFLVTGLNIHALGLMGGTAISLAGEILGAVIGFYLYRFGFSKIESSWKKSRPWQFMHKQTTGTVFFGILLFRLIPFVPSGLVTAAASLTTISGFWFFVASSIGKIPAVFVEVAAVNGFMEMVPTSYQYATALIVLAAALLVWMAKRKKDSANSRQ